MAELQNGASSALEVVQIYFCECGTGRGECDFSDVEEDYDKTSEFVKVSYMCDDEYDGME